MYCKKCGTQIDDDSEFCKKCGTEQKENNEIQENTANTKSNKPSLPGCIIWIIVTSIIISIITVVIAGITNDNKRNEQTNNSTNDYENNEPQLFTRNANNNDIQIKYETNYSALAVDIIILPNTNIENLEIKIVHCDKNNNVLLTQYKTIGNVTKGIQVKTQMKLLDFSLSDMFKVNSTSITVSNGTVSYFK